MMYQPGHTVFSLDAFYIIYLLYILLRSRTKFLTKADLPQTLVTLEVKTEVNNMTFAGCRSERQTTRNAIHRQIPLQLCPLQYTQCRIAQGNIIAYQVYF